MKMIHLTKTELEIINHRLSLSDALADAISDNDELNYQWEQVEAAAHQLWKRLDGKAGIELDVDNLTDLDKLILVDCIEGSTFMTGDEEDEVAIGRITRGHVLQWKKAGHSIIEKFRNAGLITTESFPWQ